MINLSVICSNKLLKETGSTEERALQRVKRCTMSCASSEKAATVVVRCGCERVTGGGGAGVQAQRDRIAAVAKLGGGKCIQNDFYPGWAPNPESKVVKLAEEVFTELLPDKPQLLVRCHAAPGPPLQQHSGPSSCGSSHAQRISPWSVCTATAVDMTQFTQSSVRTGGL